MLDARKVLYWLLEESLGDIMVRLRTLAFFDSLLDFFLGIPETNLSPVEDLEGLLDLRSLQLRVLLGGNRDALVQGEVGKAVVCLKHAVVVLDVPHVHRFHLSTPLGHQQAFTLGHQQF